MTTQEWMSFLNEKHESLRQYPSVQWHRGELVIPDMALFIRAEGHLYRDGISKKHHLQFGDYDVGSPSPGFCNGNITAGTWS